MKCYLTQRLSVLLFVLISLCSCVKNYHTTTVLSPDSTIMVHFELNESGEPKYSVKRGDTIVLMPSALGLITKQGNLSSGFEIKDVDFQSVTSTWEPLWGEESQIESSYNEMRVSLSQSGGDRFAMDIVFRVFDDGFGFRYEYPRQSGLESFTIVEELSEFALVGDPITWSIPVKTRFYEALYTPAPASKLDWVSTPVTIEDSTRGLYYAIHEANLTDYAAMNLKPKSGSSVLKAELTPWSSGDKVYVDSLRHTPWRTMIIAQSPSELMLSRLMLNLNEPSVIEDTSWIKTGKYIGIWWEYHRGLSTWHQGERHGATTNNVLRYMDFAAKHNFQGVLVEGWNKDWKTWDFSFTEPYSDFDIKRITDRGRELGVALIGHHETGGNTLNYESQMEDAFAMYNKYGVSAVKTGYVGDLLDGKEMHSSQYGVNHYRRVIEQAADHKIMINNHEPIIPTGLQRTYPNLMTQEGVRGQEWDAWDAQGGNPPSHTTILPFTRGLAGPMDFTPVTFDFSNPVHPNTRVQTTLAKQLALFVVLYSPWQMASDMIDNYQKNPEPFKFIEECPTTWHRTLVLEASIGNFVTVARKQVGSDRWFIGGITNENSRESTINFSFLEPNKKYRATIYRDTRTSDYIDNPYAIEIETIEVDSSTIHTIFQARGGGYGILLE